MSHPKVTRLVPQGVKAEADASVDVYAFGPIRVDVARHVVAREGLTLALTPKAFELLLILVRSGGRVLSRQELVAALWPDTFVEEANLSFQIWTLRKALGDSPDVAMAEADGAEQWIETIPKTGYRFTAAVTTESATSVAPDREPAQPATVHAPDLRRDPRVAVLLAGALIALAIVVLLAMRQHPPTPPSVGVPAMFSIPLPDSLAAINGQLWPFVSPDGSRIAVLMTDPTNTSRGIWLRPLRAADGAFIEGCRGAVFLEWSPDSSRLVCALPQSPLKVLSLADGSSRDFCAGCEGSIGKMSWSARGVLLFYREHALFAVVEGGRPVLVTAPDRSRGEVERTLPAFLPDGEHFTFMVQNKDSSRHGLYLGRLDVAAAALASGAGTAPVSAPAGLLTSERLLQPEIPALYGDRHIIYSHRGDIMARPFDPVRRQFTGRPAVLLPERSWMRHSLGGVVTLWLSETGLFVFGKVEHPRTEFQWIDRAGKRLGPLGEPGQHVSFDLSPDGRRLAITTLEDTRASLWIRDVERGGLSRVSFPPFDFDMSPRWLPDSRRLVISRSPRVPSDSELFVVAENGDLRRLDAPAGCFPDDVLRDGRYVLCRTGAIVAVSLQGERPIEVYRPAIGGVGRVAASPDSQWVAYTSRESGRLEVYLTRLAPGGERWMVSVEGGLQPRWRADGRELFYVGLDGTLYAVGITLPDAGRPVLTRPVPLFHTGLVSPSSWLEQYDVSNDGQRFLFLLPLEQRIRRSIGVLQNWPAMLREATESRADEGTARRGQ